MASIILVAGHGRPSRRSRRRYWNTDAISATGGSVQYARVLSFESRLPSKAVALRRRRRRVQGLEERYRPGLLGEKGYYRCQKS